jgi:hypothetical protein
MYFEIFRVKFFGAEKEERKVFAERPLLLTLFLCSLRRKLQLTCC